MGQKTSFYLTDDLIPRVQAAKAEHPDASLGDIMRWGLDARGPTSVEAVVRRVVREELAEALKALQAVSGPSGVPSEGGEAGKPTRARTEPPGRVSRAAPKSGTRAKRVAAAAAAVSADDPGAARRLLASVPPATAVFQEPGSQAKAGHPVPRAADHSAKRGLR